MLCVPAVADDAACVLCPCGENGNLVVAEFNASNDLDASGISGSAGCEWPTSTNTQSIA